MDIGRSAVERSEHAQDGSHVVVRRADSLGLAGGSRRVSKERNRVLGVLDLDGLEYVLRDELIEGLVHCRHCSQVCASKRKEEGTYSLPQDQSRRSRQRG